MNHIDITTQKEIRAQFWESNQHFKRKGQAKQNTYNVDIRMAFCDYVEYLNRSGVISEALANRATL